MPEFYPEIEIDHAEAEAMAYGLFTVARADGDIHPAEKAMISEFFASTTENPADLGALERAPTMEAETLAQALGSKELRELFTKTALLLAYTDGTCADGEKAAIAKYAKALEISDADLADLHVQVKEFLLAHLSHLTNVEAGAKVAGELEL